MMWRPFQRALIVLVGALGRALTPITILLMVTSAAVAQGPWGQPLDWQSSQIAAVLTSRFDDGQLARKISVGDHECLSGGRLYFDVRDAFAFDIDEAVWLDLDFYLGASAARVGISYDRNDLVDDSNAISKVDLPGSPNGGRWLRQSVLLSRARFSNLGFEGTDFSVFPLPEAPARVSSRKLQPLQFTLCGVSLRRSLSPPVVRSSGTIDISVFDESRALTPARVGLYDSSGRLPLPSDQALSLRDSVHGTTRVFQPGRGMQPWPHANREVFYTDGHYKASVPEGTYDLVVAKGPEYRLAQRRIHVTANHEEAIQIRLERWVDMAAAGWYSGEDHIHYPRDSANDDRALDVMVRAEDLKVANILQMGDHTRAYLSHYDWQTVRLNPSQPYDLIPGQEDPRTSLLGHTIELNIGRGIRDPTHYLLYHSVFEQAHRQGGLVGYAHVVPEQAAFHAASGLAVDVPLGLVDFVEVMSGTYAGTDTWFDFLNLGYRLPPTAGTDWPFGGVAGNVRSYVRVSGTFAPQKWFDSLKDGHTFVTSGPMLDFQVNGQCIGSVIVLKKGEALKIEAHASLNPDYGPLSSLQLIELGKPIQSSRSTRGEQALNLSRHLKAEHGSWFLIRADGQRAGIVALSGPIYVTVDGERSWNPAEVSTIVERLKSKMKEVAAVGPGYADTTDPLEDSDLFERFQDAQLDVLRARIEKASLLYDQIAEDAKRGRAGATASP